MDVPADLPAMLERWVARGIITAAQADRIRAETAGEASEPVIDRPVRRAVPLVTEAVGYLGGVIIVVALGLVTGQFWADLSAGARLGLSGGVTVLLLAAGAGLRREPGGAGGRLRAVLWVAACVVLAGFLSLAGTEGLSWSADASAVLAAGGCAAVSVVLWSVHRHVLQHLAVLVSLLATAGTATALLPDPGVLPALAAWAVAVGWTGLARSGALPPARAGTVAGAVAGVVAAVVVAERPWGAVLALLTVAALVVMAVATRDLILLGVASLGTLAVLPQAVDRFFPGVLPAAVALLGVGAILVAVAVFTARRQSRPNQRILQ